MKFQKTQLLFSKLEELCKIATKTFDDLKSIRAYIAKFDNFLQFTSKLNL